MILQRDIIGKRLGNQLSISLCYYKHSSIKVLKFNSGIIATLEAEKTEAKKSTLATQLQQIAFSMERKNERILGRYTATGRKVIAIAKKRR